MDCNLSFFRVAERSVYRTCRQAHAPVNSLLKKWHYRKNLIFTPNAFLEISRIIENQFSRQQKRYFTVDLTFENCSLLCVTNTGRKDEREKIPSAQSEVSFVIPSIAHIRFWVPLFVVRLHCWQEGRQAQKKGSVDENPLNHYFRKFELTPCDKFR